MNVGQELGLHFVDRSLGIEEKFHASWTTLNRIEHCANISIRLERKGKGKSGTIFLPHLLRYDYQNL